LRNVSTTTERSEGGGDAPASHPPEDSKSGSTTTDRPWVLPAADPRTRRVRRVATPLVIVVAALAAVGTSPAPPETSELSASAGDVVHLDAANPRAAIELTVRSNAAAWPTSSNLHEARAGIEVAPTTQDAPAATSGDLPYRVLIEPADESELIRTSTGLRGVEAILPLRDACEQGASCERQYRVLIGLVEPETEPIDLRWDAKAALAYIEGTQPADAEIAIEAAEVDPGPAVALGFGSLSGEEAIGADNPVVVHELILRRPAPGDAALADEGRLSLRVDVETPPAGNEAAYPPIEAVLTRPRATQPIHGARPWEHGGLQHVDPFDECPPDGPCEVPLVLAFRWPGGQVGDTAAFSWQLDAWGAAAGTADDPFGLTMSRSLTLPSDPDSVTVSVSGVAEIVAGAQQVYANHWLHVPRSILDAPGFAGGQIPGTARLRATSSADRELPDDVEVRIDLFPGASAGQWISPMGGMGDIAADVMTGSWDSDRVDYGCTAAGCKMPVGISIWIADHHENALRGARVTVDWTMDVTIPYFEGDAPVDGAEIRLEEIDRFPW
jgi:hypothetical protein